MKKFLIVLVIVFLFSSCSSFRFSAEKIDTEISKVDILEVV